MQPSRCADLQLTPPAGYDDRSEIVFIGPIEGDYRPSVVVTSVKVDPLVSPTEYAASQLDGLRKMSGEDFVVISQGPVSIARAAGYRRVFRSSLGEDRLKITQLQVYLNQGPIIYVITCTDLTSRFQMSLPLFDQMLRQTRFVNSERATSVGV